MVVNAILLGLLLTLVIIELAKVWRRTPIEDLLRTERETYWERAQLHLDVIHNLAARDMQAVRTDLTDLYGMVAEESADVRLLVQQRTEPLERLLDMVVDRQLTYHRETAEGILPYLKRIEVHIGKAEEGIGSVERQLTFLVGQELLPRLAEILEASTDPSVLRELKRLVGVFMLPGDESTITGRPVEPMESPEPSILHRPVQALGARVAEAGRFSDQTVSRGADELIQGAMAAGIRLPRAEAERQAVLMLAGEEID